MWGPLRNARFGAIGPGRGRSDHGRGVASVPNR